MVAKKKYDPSLPQTYQIGTTNLSREEYKAAKAQLGLGGGRGGKVTPESEAAVSKFQKEGEATAAERRKEATMTELETQRQERIVKAEFEQNLINQQKPQVSPSQDQLTPLATQPQEPQPQQPQQTQQQIGGVFPENSAIGRFERKVNEFGAANLGAGSLVDERQAFTMSLKSSIAGFADWVRTGVTGRQPLKIQVAQESLQDSMTALNDIVESVKLGYGEIGDAEAEFRRMEDAISEMESFNKSIWKENLRGWIDGGSALDGDIARAKTDMERIKQELDIMRARKAAGLI